MVDLYSRFTNHKESIFIEYGRPKPEYPDIFDDHYPVNSLTLALSVQDFVVTYLEFLQKIPLKPQVYPQIDKLLANHKRLFTYVASYNWDNGEAQMEYIVRSKLCDKATVLY